jgi:hypothetical protein
MAGKENVVLTEYVWESLGVERKTHHGLATLLALKTKHDSNPGPSEPRDQDRRGVGPPLSSAGRREAPDQGAPRCGDRDRAPPCRRR